MIPGGLVIAAPASGSGKTLLTLGLLAHLAASGRKVASAKVGPDYIDPAFHAAATGRACLNLDSWAMRAETLASRLAQLGRQADLLIAEGVMGLFDGAFVTGAGADGSTADVARRTGWPVVLVIDARGMGASAAALAAGFVGHDRRVKVAAIILNRVGNERHRLTITRALAAPLPDVPVLGALPHDAALALPSRHLGLVQAEEHQALDAFLAEAGRLVALHVDVAALVALARPAQPMGEAGGGGTAPLGQRIAIARDRAFAFAYEGTLADWHRQGAELSFFSPLTDQGPDATADAVFLPGGYPELHAPHLAAARGFLDGLKAAAKRGAVLYGECGGYMVLGRGLVDETGCRHAMAGLLPVETDFSRPRRHLGYRHAVLTADCPGLGAKKDAFRGHEFHYASPLAEDGPPLFAIADAAGQALGNAGCCQGRVMGSFIHLIDRA